MRHLGSNDRWSDYRRQTNVRGSGAVREAPVRHRWGVILAGGDGTRLQPLTRLACGDNRPKQFCPLLGGETLLARTRQRISSVINSDRVLFVLTKTHERFYEKELESIPPCRKVVQPNNRGTLPAILWGLLRLVHADRRALVAFFPSDHYFENEDAFNSTIDHAFDVADTKRDSVILLGAGAERPETEYGWIEPRYVAESMHDYAPVRRFWEKPPLDTAIELLAHGCLWNTFVMIGSASAFLGIIRHAAPALFETFDAAFPGRALESEEQRMRVVYNGIEPCDFSRQVLALSTERLLVANCGEVGWSDLGEPRRFIAAVTENGAENPWATANACKECGLTREQAVTLSGHIGSDISSNGAVMLTSSS